MLELLLIAQLSLTSITEISVIGAHGVDLSTTSWAIGFDSDKFKESNPILKHFSNKPIPLGLAKVGLALGVNIPLRLYIKPRSKLWYNVINIGQTIAIGYVAYRNQDLVKK